MNKEYFFILTLKTGEVFTVRDSLPEEEAAGKQRALHKYYEAKSSYGVSPAKYLSVAAFLYAMEVCGFDGHVHASPF